MKPVLSLMLSFVVVLVSCTDRDDNLTGIQIRVQNNTETLFAEVVIDTLSFFDIQPQQQKFYKNYSNDRLPERMSIRTDSLMFDLTVDNQITFDTTDLNLFTYRIFKMDDSTDFKATIVKD